MLVWFAACIPENSKGGIASSMRGLSNGLLLRGHRTKIVFSRSNYLIFTLRLGIKLLLCATNPPDWIIARSSDGAFCTVLVKLLRLKTRIALHNHGWEEIVTKHEEQLQGKIVLHPTTWKARAIRFPLLRMTLSLCSCCLSGTLSEVRWLKNHYPRLEKKMFYVPNGVSISKENFRIGSNVDPPFFLTVGGHTWKKNLEHAINVFKEVSVVMPRARLFMVGTGSINHSLADIIDGNKSIEVISEEDPLQMSKWYEKCPYFISCSRYEGGHSFAILEAMAHGCVVFASTIDSTRELITNNENGILIGNETSSDAMIVASVLENNELVAHIRHNAYKTALRNRLDRQVYRLDRILCSQL
jgi:glycosyltransferase involved in cell wall biosynthesis